MIKKRSILSVVIFKKFKDKPKKIKRFIDILEYRLEWLMHVILEFTDVMPWPF